MMKKYQMASIIRDMSKTLPPSRTAPQFVIRFPDDDMRDRIAEAAKANGRSMNAEIVARLQSSFNETPSSDSKSAVNNIEERLNQLAEEMHASRSYVDYMLKVIEARSAINGLPAADSTKSKTPTIPGVNAPKRGIGAPKKKSPKS